MSILSRVASAARAVGQWLADKIKRVGRRHTAAMRRSETYRQAVRAVLTTGVAVAAAFISAQLAAFALSLGLLYVAYHQEHGPEEAGDAAW